MDFLVAFLEGVISFLSPCLLPMLPIYILYFAGGEEGNRTKTIANALAFVAGFSVVFTLLGVFSGVIGQFLLRYERAMQIVSGLLVITLGLNYLGLINIKFLNHHAGANSKVKISGLSSAFVFGLMFAITWSPCAGSFLGAALAMAASSGSALHGAIMLLCYSAGLGLLFILSAVLVDKLKSTLDFIKKHYSLINKISGGLLIVLGVLMITGLFEKFIHYLA